MSSRNIKKRWLSLAALGTLALASTVLANGEKFKTNQVGSVQRGKQTGRVKAQVYPTRSARARDVASPGAVQARAASDLVFGVPIAYQNISLVPVGTTAQGPFQRYTLLEDGLRGKTLQVRELRGQSGDAEVNAVEVRNRGNQPVYLLGGEAILGGKQDRIIQQDTVISNNNKWTRVPVFCVEQGRWAGRNMRFSAGQALAHTRLQKAALSGDQGAVWAEVARKNLKHGTQSSTSTYRRTIQNARVRAKISPYRKQLADMLPPGMKLAGMVFAVNGRIRVADLFGNPDLYASLQDKLLSSYILEALEEQVERNAAPLSMERAKKFIDDGRNAKSYKAKKAGRSINYQKKGSNGLVGSETVDQGTGKKVRETYFH